MKSKLNRPPGLLLKTGVMAFFVMTLAWLPQANAALSEGAVIENAATVTWDDSVNSGNPAYTATDTTQVTVNLVYAAPTLSGRPTNTPGQEGDQATPPAGQTVMSGTNADYLYAVTANANGADTYTFSGTSIASAANVTGQSITWELTNAAGAVPGAFSDPANVTLGAAIVVANAANASSLSFPGGSLSGFAEGDIVVVNGIDYRIATGGINAGAAPAYPAAETLATLTLEANPDGSNLNPAASGAITAGTVVGEQQLFYVRITATYSSSPATVNHDVVLNNSNTPTADSDQILGVVTTFDPLPTVSITKEVRNITTNSAFAASGTGDPGDILEYRLTISNAGSTAESVVVTDPVPTYTTLETFVGSYPDPLAATPSTALGTGGGAATAIFAHVSDSAGTPVTVDLTVQNSDDEGTTVASGDAAGTAAGSTLSIYVGRDQTPTNTGPTVGGDIADSATVTDDVFLIYYRVRIQP